MDHTLNTIQILAAQTNRFSDMGRAFRGSRARLDSGDVIVGLLVLGGMVLGLWLLWYVHARHEKLRKRNGPLRLFHELCRAHSLRFSEEWLLWRLARAGRLRNPAQLFLEPERFDPARLPGALRGRASLFGRIKARLFPEPLDATSEEISHRGQ